MGERKKYKVDASTVTNTYVSCKIAAVQALKNAQEQEMGRLYSAMMAGVFAAFTVEAYMNHLGQRRVPNWDMDGEGLAPKEKLQLLKEKLNLSVDKSRRPFQTLHEMLILRNALAHGKTLPTEKVSIVSDPHNEAALYPQPVWMELCRLDSVERMVEDAEAMVRQLDTQSGGTRDPFASPGHGSHGIKEITTK